MATRPLTTKNLLCGFNLISWLSLAYCYRTGSPKSYTSHELQRAPGSKATAREIGNLLCHVAHEFQPWEEGITRGMVERAYCIERWTSSMRLQIINSRIFVTPPDHVFQSRERTLLHQITHLAEKYHLPDIDVVLVTDDFCPNLEWQPRSLKNTFDRCHELAPYFSLNKRKEDNHCVAMPDFTFYGKLSRLAGAVHTSMALGENQPWEKRSDVLFWKGGLTHPAREAAVQSKTLKQAGLAQIDFVDYTGDLPSEFVSLPQHCHHKYLLHQEGYAYSSRLKYLMACGSAVIYPDMIFHEFWYHLLNDSNHVAVEAITKENDGVTVLKALEALKADEAHAKAIGAAAKHLALEVLHPDNVDRYLLELFNQYSKLMTYTVKRHPDALPIEAIVLRPDSILTARNRTCTYCGG